MLAALVAVATTACDTHEPAGSFTGTLTEDHSAEVDGRMDEHVATHEDARVQISEIGERRYRIALPDACTVVADESGSVPSMHPLGQRCECRVGDRSFDVLLASDSFVQVTKDEIQVHLVSYDLGDGAEGWCKWELHGNRSDRE